MNSNEETRDPLAERLRTAVKSTEVPQFLEAKIRQRIQAQEEGLSFAMRWKTVLLSGAAALAMGVAVAKFGQLRPEAEKQEAFITSVSSRVATLMGVGLGDHLHCAFFRKYPAQAPAAGEMRAHLGAGYSDLIPVVQQNVPAQYKLVLGHRCTYGDRRFVHLALKNGDKLISLVITAKRGGESFDPEAILPGLAQSGVAIHASGTERFQIAAFETEDHLVYLISQLQGEQNREILAAMALSIQTILHSLAG